MAGLATGFGVNMLRDALFEITRTLPQRDTDWRSSARK